MTDHQTRREQELPPLPMPAVPNTRLPMPDAYTQGSYTAEQMRAYVLADRSSRLPVEGEGTKGVPAGCAVIPLDLARRMVRVLACASTSQIGDGDATFLDARKWLAAAPPAPAETSAAVLRDLWIEWLDGMYDGQRFAASRQTCRAWPLRRPATWTAQCQAEYDEALSVPECRKP